MSDYKITGPGVDIVLTDRETRRLVSLVRGALHTRQRYTGLFQVEVDLQRKLKDVVVP